MPLPWNEINVRAAKFASEWKDAKNEQADKQTFWNEFFQIFGVERKSLALYEKAVDRLGKAKGFIDLFWPGMLIVEHKSLGKPLDAAYDQAADYALSLPPSEQPRYLITSDFQSFRLYDMAAATGPKYIEIYLKDLPKKAHMFSFIGGYKKQEIVEEDPVNRRAAERLAELHDQLKNTGYSGHDLEVLLVRLLFCLFAEDSGVFEKELFHDFVYNETDIYGSDLGVHLTQLFEVLDTPKQKRQSNLNPTLKEFPYINGNLFSERIAIPTFDHKMRDSLLNASHTLDWSYISPAIFGAMFQGVMDPQQRRSLGAHYTSEQNILKVIRPLFLDLLWAEFEIAKENSSSLKAFYEKLSKLTFMDPACGCGNFLVVSYRELRKLELEALKILYSHKVKEGVELDLDLIVKCNVDQFYGIEVEEFPAQIAQVALWLTDVQMNNKAAEHFGKPLIRLPLMHSPTIVQADALQIDWKTVISPLNLNYLFGNPPFSGGKLMSQHQRDQIVDLFPKGSGAGVLDFVAGWYAKTIEFIQGTKIKAAFVSTNSISQGEQVGILWKYMFEKRAKINFAHRTFRWSNDASGKAAVFCVIIGFWLDDAKQKVLFDYAELGGEPHAIIAKNINPYLVDGPNILISKRSKPLCKVPKMQFGNMPLDGGNLLLDEAQKQQLVKKEPLAEAFVKPLISAKELLSGERRWCLWLVDAKPNELQRMPEVLKRIEAVRSFRLASIAPSTQKFAATPSLFRDTNWPASAISIPRVSSENRTYVPMGFFGRESIVSDTCMSLPDATLYHFGVLESKMHMTWMRYVAGRLKNDYRYSKDIVYNNFPWPKSNKDQEASIQRIAQNILDERAKHKDSSLADLYSHLTMPPGLLKLHQSLDHAVDQLYTKVKFDSDPDRMQFLFSLYEKYLSLV